VDSKSSRSFKNLFSAIIKGLATSVIGFVITPYLIHYVGDEQFGLYKIILDWLSNVWIFDLGVSGAFLAIAAMKIKDADKKELFRDGFYKYFTALPLMYIACFGFYVFTRFIIKLETVSISDYTISFFIIALTFIFYPLNAFRQYFEVSERLNFINKVTIVQLVLTNIFSLVFAYLGFGLVGLSFAYSLFIALGFIYIYYRACRELDLKYKDLFKERGRYITMIKGEGKNFLFINISQKISFLADNTIIAYFYNASMIVPFFISGRLAGLFQGQVQSVTYSGWASLIAFYNDGERETFKLRLVELLKGNFVLSLACLCVIWVLNESFITLWIGKEYFIDQSFTIIVSLLSLVNILNFFLGHVLSGTGHVSHQSKAYIITGISNLILSIVLTLEVGLYGPVLASLITMGLLLVYKLILLNRIYAVSLTEQLLLFLPSSLFAALIIFFYPYLFNILDASSWMKIITHGAILGLSLSVLSFLFCFTKLEKETWIKRLRRVLKL
jgi:O-antigen/teichoic acid export membrane protein